MIGIFFGAIYIKNNSVFIGKLTISRQKISLIGAICQFARQIMALIELFCAITPIDLFQRLHQCIHLFPEKPSAILPPHPGFAKVIWLIAISCARA
ncbi:MAG: hypothetical protein ACYC9L_02540 [Sulfuricaulis sp.]